MRVLASVVAAKASLLLAMVVSCSGGSPIPRASVDQAPTKTSICSIMANPKAFGGKAVEVVGRITATKEGIDIWDPSCRGVGIDLSIDYDVHADNGFEPLEALLKTNGLSDYPVIATIQGSFMPDQYDKIRRKKRTLLRVQKAMDVHLSAEEEYR